MSIDACMTTTLLTFAVLVAGCDRTAQHPPADTGNAMRAAVESPGAVATRRGAWDESAARAARSLARSGVAEPGPLATRHEAQASFDRARGALVAQDYRASARYLEEAVAFMRSHAAQSEVGALAALQGSAKELEVLAQRLARGDVQTTRAFDRVVANANRAEAQHHLTRAGAALADRAYRPAGEELIMAVDHLERAAHDLRQPNAPEAGRALGEARALAERLMGSDVPARADVKRVTGQLEAELRRLCAIIDLEARACAVEAAR
jgi:hypothetical protein